MANRKLQRASIRKQRINLHRSQYPCSRQKNIVNVPDFGLSTWTSFTTIDTINEQTDGPPWFFQTEWKAAAGSIDPTPGLLSPLSFTDCVGRTGRREFLSRAIPLSYARGTPATRLTGWVKCSSRFHRSDSWPSLASVIYRLRWTDGTALSEKQQQVPSIPTPGLPMPSSPLTT
ncbi:hypothetical protein BO83DRAFT_429146 [Aspergillus eucalypticola CBS 122712]|uniref:Uncharacterized protein n=1 Tax=Aspergillus eucalypticola (strain CBS 122712 / IBT 29274) TaxID=1448314 RepID=A0A317V846_ASPEC|nr:uncharacterized protein BO83DRAFT_429146 [Aspergillus eucalypticola CBS 122712]PWY68240.1 hypothetical protein BO83DRAFT_429146 [Aspergillus eucalypticola CBS 122712]